MARSGLGMRELRGREATLDVRAVSKRAGHAIATVTLEPVTAAADAAIIPLSISVDFLGYGLQMRLTDSSISDASFLS